MPVKIHTFAEQGFKSTGRSGSYFTIGRPWYNSDAIQAFSLMNNAGCALAFYINGDDVTYYIIVRIP